jgi:hypothetical protein
MKFKVGDKVIVKNTIDTRWINPSVIGETGIIKRVEKGGYYYVQIGHRIWEAHRGELKKG